VSWSLREPLLDFLELVPDAEATGSAGRSVDRNLLALFVPDSPSLPLFLLLRFELSLAGFCGELSPDVLDDGLLGSVMSSPLLRLLPYPALDIAAAVDFLLRVLGASADSGASSSSFSSGRERLVLLWSLWFAGDCSAEAALRLRVRVGAVGVVLVGLLVGGSLGELSAASLAADERVTLCDIGKRRSD